MVRMSDILKKTGERKKEEGPSEEIKEKVEEGKTDELQRAEIRIAPLVTKETQVASSQESMNLYEETVSLVGQLLKEDIAYEPIEIHQVTTQVEKLIDQLSLGNENMLALALIKDSTKTNYLLCHLVNTCIYSIELGQGLGYQRPKLIELGIAGLVYDIGMLKFLDLVKQAKKLNIKEDELYFKVKQHTVDGVEILKNIKGLNELVINVSQQHHERMDGSGYPKGLKQGAINEYSKIIGLADVYEAMVHPRPYRLSLLPFEAVQEILVHKQAFEYKLVKLLIERIGIFPVGSLVELNTNELAQVSKLNYDIPLRPVLKILCDADGESLKETKQLDLTLQPTIYIKRGVREDDKV